MAEVVVNLDDRDYEIVSGLLNVDGEIYLAKNDFKKGPLHHVSMKIVSAKDIKIKNGYHAGISSSWGVYDVGDKGLSRTFENFRESLDGAHEVGEFYSSGVPHMHKSIKATNLDFKDRIGGRYYSTAFIRTFNELAILTKGIRINEPDEIKTDVDNISSFFENVLNCAEKCYEKKTSPVHFTRTDLLKNLPQDK